MFKYIVNPNVEIDKEHNVIPVNTILDIVNKANDGFIQLYNITKQFDINIYETLGTRNLSGFVGEHFAKCFMLCSNNKLISNPHIDGFPDLLLNDTIEKQRFFLDNVETDENGKIHPINKEVFSPYKFGGIEVKATCGGAKNGIKLLVGEQRFPNITTLGWKAHHSNVNHLLGVLWDFINQIPTIIACFYQDNLSPNDWREPYRPTGDSHGTNMVGMSTEGIHHLCSNWWVVIDEPMYIKCLSRKQWIGYNIKNKGKLF